jgi:hypothetical protein
MSQIDMMLSRPAPSGSHAASALDGSSSKFRFGSNPAELSAAKKVCYRRNPAVDSSDLKGRNPPQADPRRRYQASDFIH